MNASIHSELGLAKFNHLFGRGSHDNLAGVFPPLVEVAQLAISICAYDGTVLPSGGLRTLEEAQDNVRRGTGILFSRHRVQPDGYGHAIDCVALTNGRVVWTNLEAFKRMAVAVKTAAAWLRVPIRQGCDFKQTGIMGSSHDWSHFEDPDEDHRARAVELMNEFRAELGLTDTDPAPSLAALTCPHCARALSLVKG